ncbi:MAG: ABC transporter ATP-binding protein/permease [Planctomycetes bacterium]|jgi:ABC-type multidrug transport system fused ATPase/permease subunit|nr:ABC transporter ATP-binding protein/permease [Planctomycetota bacterium]
MNLFKGRKNFWLDLWLLIKPFKKKIKLFFFLILFLELLKLGSPYVMKEIINTLTGLNNANVFNLIELILLFLFSEGIISLYSFFNSKRFLSLSSDMEYYFITSAQKKLLNLSLAYHEQEDTGNKIIKIEKGMYKIVDLLSNSYFEVIPTILQLIITFFAVLFVNWIFIIPFLIFTPIFVFYAFHVNYLLYPVRKKRHENVENAFGKLGQSIMNINTVQSFVQEKRENQEFKKFWDNIRTAEKLEWFKRTFFIFKRDSLVTIGRIAVIALGAYLMLNKEINIGSFVFVLTLSEKCFISLYRISRFYDNVEDSAEAVKRFIDLLKRDSNIKNKPGATIAKKIIGKISFKNLSFTYDQGNTILDNINLEINSGCFTALVGPSGGGKTTMVRLIYRHYDPQMGKVLIDDKDIREYDLYSLRKNMAIVPQEVEIFNSSIKHNIAYANPDASFEEIKAAARIANAEQFIINLKEGYETVVGERGVKLSGGQRQRIGIARALLANPRILIFDEATSNLDSCSEKLIQEAIDRIAKDRTLIVVAHRLSTIQKADKIIVLEKGKIVEEGNHLALAQKGAGLYSKLLSLQKMGDIK